MLECFYHLPKYFIRKYDDGIQKYANMILGGKFLT